MKHEIEGNKKKGFMTPERKKKLRVCFQVILEEFFRRKLKSIKTNILNICLGNADKLC